MKRILNSTTILSMALMPMAPMPSLAQVMDEAGRILAADGTVLCEPTAEITCDLTNPDILARAAEVQARMDEAAAAEAAAAEAAAAEAAAAEAAAAEAAAAEAAAAEAAAAEAAAAEAAAAETADAQDSQAAPLPSDNGTEPALQDPAPITELAPEADSAEFTEATAGLVVEETPLDPNAALIDAPQITDTESEALTNLLAQPAQEASAPAVAAPIDAAPVMVTSDLGDPTAVETALTAIPVSPDAVTTTVETVTDATARSSSQEFAAAPKTVAPGKKTGLSDLERVGLFVLGAVVIGQVLDKATGRGKVVSNTGDRVVVKNPDGTYGLYKDDDAILRQPGSTVRTETYDDGSSRTIVQRADGTQVVTVRNATGRVLRRAQYDRLGRELVLLDDFAAETPVNVSQLPRARVIGETSSEDAALRAAISARQIEKLGRGFSLRQIRDIPQVRALAAEVDVDNVTFTSGSAAITPAQANALADLGAVMQDMLVINPAEMFLIEGHTDAVGAEAMNLALSDRRAETVALALSEYFDIPPENMIVQGYGETELRVDTQAAEPKNRRVSVRVITPLLNRPK